MAKFVLNKRRGKFNKDHAIKLLEARMYRLPDEQREHAVRLANKWYRTGGLSKGQWQAVRWLPKAFNEDVLPSRSYSPCYVYLVSDGEYVKVGISDNPSAKLQSLQTSHPAELSIADKYLFQSREAARMMEKHIHEACKRFKTRMNGEWFTVEAAQVFSDACSMEYARE